MTMSKLTSAIADVDATPQTRSKQKNTGRIDISICLTISHPPMFSTERSNLFNSTIPRLGLEPSIYWLLNSLETHPPRQAEREDSEARLPVRTCQACQR